MNMQYVPYREDHSEVWVGLKASKKLRDEFKQAAKERGIGVSEYIRWLMQQAINQHKQGDQPK